MRLDWIVQSMKLINSSHATQMILNLKMQTIKEMMNQANNIKCPMIASVNQYWHVDILSVILNTKNNYFNMKTNLLKNKLYITTKKFQFQISLKSKILLLNHPKNFK